MGALACSQGGEGGGELAPVVGEGEGGSGGSGRRHKLRWSAHPLGGA